MDVRLEISRFHTLSESLRAEIDEMSERLGAYTVNGVIRATPEWRLLLWDGDDWVTRLDIFPRMITAGAEPVFVGGVGGLMTRPEWRKRGHAAKALNHAAEFIRDTLKADFGLLLCAPADVNFYIRSKWQVVPGPTNYHQPAGRQLVTPGEIITMIYPCGGELWHVGAINLCGLPW